MHLQYKIKTMKRSGFIIIIFLLAGGATKAVTWETVHRGNWSSTAVWLGGNVPPYSCADTILIKHPVVLDSTLSLNSGAHLHIDSMGGICGHQRITVGTGAKIISYGILELDSLVIPGGDVKCLVPGLVVLTHYGFLSNSGNMFTNCSFSVGPWFDCHLPEYSFALGMPSLNTTGGFAVFPNPFSAQATLQADLVFENATIMITNCLGQTVKQLNNVSGHTIALSREGLLPGLYFIRLVQNNKTIPSVKFLIIDN
jgi:hypothetical protein